MIRRNNFRPEWQKDVGVDLVVSKQESLGVRFLLAETLAPVELAVVTSHTRYVDVLDRMSSVIEKVLAYTKITVNIQYADNANHLDKYGISNLLHTKTASDYGRMEINLSRRGYHTEITPDVNDNRYHLFDARDLEVILKENVYVVLFTDVMTNRDFVMKVDKDNAALIRNEKGVW